MGDKRYLIVVDDEPGIRETYQQYLAPAEKPKSSALGKLRKMKAEKSGDSTASPPAAAKQVLPTGWEFLAAASGEEALELAGKIQAAGGELCVGLFDVKMPGGIDGIETMIRLLAQFPEMRCGIVTAYNDRSVDEINSLFEERHRDRWDCISKPFTEMEVRQKARMLASTWAYARAEATARAELASLNENLEQLVTERTRELTEAKEELAKKEARMREELDAAAQVQWLLYPERWPADGGLEIASWIEPSVETGGDICGYLHGGNGELAVFICDVTGHGAAAALGTALLYSCLKSVETEAQKGATTLVPGEILRRLNTVVLDTTKGSLFASAFVAVFERQHARVRYASAGHEWPLTVRSEQTGILPLLASPLLGSEPTPHYADLEWKMDAGDVMFMYTDGLTDAKSPSGRPLDRRRLFQALKQAPKNSAEAVQRAIDEAFRTHVPAGTPLEDDVTYVVVRATTSFAQN